MKKSISYPAFGAHCLCIVFAMMIISCKKESINTDVPKPPEAGGGQITSIGEVLGIAVTTTIGTSGGTLQSDDGRLRLSIPVGAVSGNEKFSVQRISNTNVAGLGAAYRLLPHGVHFLKPVTISFLYDEGDIEGTSIEAMGIAWQDTSGIWQGSGAIRDSIAKTLSISTSHFSDWSLFASFMLFPATTTLEPGKSLELSVVNFTSDDELVPPTPGEVKGIGPQRNVTTRYIKAWKLAGTGKLQPDGKVAVYTAPSAIPSKNPVAVSVSLNGPNNGQYLLVSNIYIGVEGISFRIDNGPWIHGTIPLGLVVANGIQNIDAAVVSKPDDAANAALSLKWKNYPSEGRVNWGETMPWFLYQPPGNTAYQQFLVEGKNIIPSPGGIEFSHYSEMPGGDIIGTFILERAGKRIITNSEIKWTPVKIEGFFKTKRNTF